MEYLSVLDGFFLFLAASVRLLGSDFRRRSSAVQHKVFSVVFNTLL